MIAERELSLDDLELDVLRRLAMLAEGACSAYDRPNLHRAHPGSTPPPGSDVQGVLSQNVSLATYHQGLMRQAREKGVSALLVAIAAAELDYQTAVRRPPAYIDADSEQNAEDRDEAILRWAGKRAEVVAVFEQCSFSHVRKLRRIHKLKPSDGLPVNEAA